jgi:hypothetical protein
MPLAALGLPATASALADDACTFDPPSPLLRPRAYVGHAVARPGLNQLVEKAQLRPDLHIEIRQSGCVDSVSTEFILVAPASAQRSEQEWIELARTEIAALKTTRPATAWMDLIAFLKPAHNLPLRGGIRSLCRDGSAPGSGGCPWESLGGYELSIRRSATSNRISAKDYISG